MKKFIGVIIINLIFAFVVSAAIHPEVWYQDKWCAEHKGRTEVFLDEDNAYCDCLTDTHAIEFDFGRKWQEAIGQSLEYGRLTSKKPGIVLILEAPSQEKYLTKLEKTLKAFGLDSKIDIWVIRLWEMKK